MEDDPILPDDSGFWRRVRLSLPYIWFTVIFSISIFNFFFATNDWRGGALGGSDAQAYYAPLRSLVIDGDLDFENEFGELNYHGHGRDALLAWPRSPQTGLIFNRFPLGYALMFLPFFLVAHGLSAILGGLGIGMFDANGYSALYQLAIVFNAWFWASCAYYAHRLVMRRYFSPVIGDWVTFVVFLSFQGIFASVTFWMNPQIQSLFVFCLLVLTMGRLDDGDTRWVMWGSLGILTGWLALLRTELGLVAFYTFMMFLVIFWREWARYSESAGPLDKSAKKRRFFGATISATAAPAGFILVFMIQVVYWRLLWGEWFVVKINSEDVDSYFQWGSPELVNVLFSTRHGLFYWSPILFFGFIGFVGITFSGRSDSTLRLGFVQLLVLYYLYASWSVWWMGYSYGARQFIILTPFFSIGLCLIVEYFWYYRKVLFVVASGFIFWNLTLLWLFLNGHIPSSGEYAFPPLMPVFKAWGLLMEKLGL